MVVQSPTNDNEVHVHGGKLELVSEERTAILKNRFPKFEIKFFEDTRQNHTQIMAGIVKKHYSIHHEWKPFNKSAQCELLVYADEMKQKEPIRKYAVYAVLPAHLIFDEDPPHNQNYNQVLLQPTDSGYFYDHPTHDIKESRRVAEEMTTCTRYTIEAAPSQLSVDDYNLSHPPLFSYRQRFLLNPANLVETPEDYRMRSQGVKVKICPFNICLSIERRECRHLYMNDLALLYIAPKDKKDEVNLMKLVTSFSSPYSMGKLLSINSMDQVENMCGRRLEIAIASYEGYLCRPPIAREDGNSPYAIRLPFILTSSSQGFVVKA